MDAAIHRHLSPVRQRDETSNASVSYKFEVFENVNPTSTLALGQAVTGTIASPGDEATYTFTITSPGSPSASASSTTVSTRTSASLNAILTDPYGNTIFNNNAQYNEGPYSLTYAGTYTLTVYSSGTNRATGKYGFSRGRRDVTGGRYALTSAPARPSAARWPAAWRRTSTSSAARTPASGSTTRARASRRPTPPTSPSSTSRMVPSLRTMRDPDPDVDAARHRRLSAGCSTGPARATRSITCKFEVFENVEPTSTIGLGTPATGTIANPGDEATQTFTITPAQLAAGQRPSSTTDSTPTSAASTPSSPTPTATRSSTTTPSTTRAPTR